MDSDMQHIKKPITIKLPQNLLSRLEQKLEPSERDRFIAEAIEQRLSFEEQFTALEEPAMRWFLEPEEEEETLPDDDIISWLSENGRSDWKRPSA